MRTCVDIDECSDQPGLCVGNCLNEPGSYMCSCPTGYRLLSSGRKCTDIDECAEGTPCRGQDQHCHNTRGG